MAKLKPNEMWVEGGLLKREARARVVEGWLSLKLEPEIAKQTRARLLT